MNTTPISTETQPGFEKVETVLRQSFADGQELGVQFHACQNGEPLVKICAGWADRRKTKPVKDDHLFSVYSSGKAVAAIIIAWLVEQGRLDYGQRVASIWPEFASQGKDRLTIAQLMSHQSGLSGITNPEWTPEDYFDWDKTCAELAAQKPIFEPGSVSGYSPITYGFLAGEIARRADKHGRMLGQILKDEFARGFDLDVWIGLPPSEHERCVDMKKPRALADLGGINPATQAAFINPWSTPGGKSIEAWRQAEFAGSNCHATAEGLARMMQIAVNGGCGNQEILSRHALSQLQTPVVSGPDMVLPFDVSFTPGLMLNAPNFIYGPNPDTVGHSGWGGSCVFADAETGLHGAYVMNRQENSLIGDKRAVNLINALYDCL